jgi:hypothetical protein
VADAELVFTTCRYSERSGVGLSHLLPGEACGHVGFAASLESTIALIRDWPSQSQHFDLTPVAGSGKGPFLSTRYQKDFLISASVGLCLTATLSQRVDHLYPEAGQAQHAHARRGATAAHGQIQLAAAVEIPAVTSWRGKPAAFRTCDCDRRWSIHDLRARS